MTKVEDASTFFKKGFNCAQSLLAVYGKDLGVEYEAALKIASGFGGGIAGKGDTCGAVTGAIMIIGLKYAAADINDKAAKAKTADVSKKFFETFISRNKTVVCRDLIGYDLGANNTINNTSRADIFRDCPKYVQDAAGIIEDLLRGNHV